MTNDEWLTPYYQTIQRAETWCIILTVFLVVILVTTFTVIKVELKQIKKDGKSPKEVTDFAIAMALSTVAILIGQCLIAVPAVEASQPKYNLYPLPSGAYYQLTDNELIVFIGKGETFTTQTIQISSDQVTIGLSTEIQEPIARFSLTTDQSGIESVHLLFPPYFQNERQKERL